MLPRNVLKEHSPTPIACRQLWKEWRNEDEASQLEGADYRRGASGRGHMGQLAYESGYDLAFLDKDTDLCRQLQEAGAYSVRLISQHPRTAVINRFDVLHVDETEAVYPRFKAAALIFTAVCRIICTMSRSISAP